MAIAKDPDTAGRRFTVLTEYCRRCRKRHKNSDLQALALPADLSDTSDGWTPMENAAVTMLAAAVVGGDVDPHELLAGQDPGPVIGRLAWMIAQLAEGRVE
jgi:hypothetical protein